MRIDTQPEGRPQRARRLGVRAARAVTLGALTAAACSASSPATDGSAPPVPLVPTPRPIDEGGPQDPTSLELRGVEADDLVPEPEALEPAPNGSGMSALPAEEDSTSQGSPAGIACADISDGVCPAGCDRNNDFDCCQREQGSHLEPDPSPLMCSYDPDSGCICAAIGPFPPPRFP